MMYVIASSTVCWKVQESLPKLQEAVTSLTGKPLRRTDRHIQLCITGALQTTKNLQLPEKSGIILATGNGTVSSCANIMQTLYLDQNPPKPLHFVNALGNSACFYLSQLLNISGPSMAVSQQQLSFEAALINAQLSFDSLTTNTVLLGGADEVLLPLEQHAARLKIKQNFDFLYEGSHWLVLQKEANANAYAQVSEPELVESKADMIEKFRNKQIASAPGAPLFDRVYFNFTPDDDLLSALNVKRAQTLSPEQNCYPHSTYTGHNIVQAVEGIKTNKINNACVLTYNEANKQVAITEVSRPAESP